MQTSRIVLVACVAACCLAPLVPGAADADVGAKLREALDRKLKELDTQPLAASPRPAVSAPAAQPAPVPMLVIPQAADSEAIAKAREALHQKLKELETLPPPAASTVASGASAPALAALPSLDADTYARLHVAVRRRIEGLHQIELAGAQPGQARDRRKSDKRMGGFAFEPMKSPPSPLSEEKQQRLADLLVKYAAQSITPGEYHLQRADILAAP